jgi:hypothetical protein
MKTHRQKGFEIFLVPAILKWMTTKISRFWEKGKGISPISFADAAMVKHFKTLLMKFNYVS